MKTINDVVVHHNYLNESIFNFNELELNLFIVILYKMRNFYKVKEFVEDEEYDDVEEVDLEEILELYKSGKSLNEISEITGRSLEDIAVIMGM